MNIDMLAFEASFVYFPKKYASVTAHRDKEVLCISIRTGSEAGGGGVTFPVPSPLFLELFFLTGNARVSKDELSRTIC